MLGRWRKLIEEHGEKAIAGQGHTCDEEMMRLKRDNVRLHVGRITQKHYRRKPKILRPSQ
jgi:hypothetical protein